MKFVLNGKVSNIEAKQSQKGTTYITLRVEETFHKVDGTLQTITRYVDVFNDYLIKMDLTNGDYVNIEGTLNPKAYTSNNELKCSLGLVANNIINISLDNRVQQVQYQQPQAQEPLPNINNVVQTQTITHQYSNTAVNPNQPIINPYNQQFNNNVDNQPQTNTIITNPNYNN